ncbi:MAG: hypothetical protein MAG795_01020 [Candidatus Woesearchaeota archaeon]|nr:hypothetical protein [Candidatus Woesearchaeota archaeon]
MAKQKISMPSSMGGLTRYFDEYKSKIKISPGLVIIASVIVIILVIILQIFGKRWLG